MPEKRDSRDVPAVATNVATSLLVLLRPGAYQRWRSNAPADVAAREALARRPLWWLVVVTTVVMFALPSICSPRARSIVGGFVVLTLWPLETPDWLVHTEGIKESKAEATYWITRPLWGDENPIPYPVKESTWIKLGRPHYVEKKEPPTPMHFEKRPHQPSSEKLTFGWVVTITIFLFVLIPKVFIVLAFVMCIPNTVSAYVYEEVPVEHFVRHARWVLLWPCVLLPLMFCEPYLNAAFSRAWLYCYANNSIAERVMAWMVRNVPWFLSSVGPFTGLTSAIAFLMSGRYRYQFLRVTMFGRGRGPGKVAIWSIVASSLFGGVPGMMLSIRTMAKSFITDALFAGVCFWISVYGIFACGVLAAEVFRPETEDVKFERADAILTANPDLAATYVKFTDGLPKPTERQKRILKAFRPFRSASNAQTP